MINFNRLAIVIPYAPWCYQQSYNILGKPAMHLIITGELKTFCKKAANGWADHGGIDHSEVNKLIESGSLCKNCSKVYLKESKNDK